MISDENYQAIPHLRNGGPSAKEGFQVEEYWGINKIFDLYASQDEEFFVIFDNYCDIEFGMAGNNTIRFDQVKTESVGQDLFVRENKLIYRNEAGHSIFGELARFGENDSVDGVDLVWNYRFRDSTNKIWDGSFCFKDLPQSDKDAVLSAVSCENITSIKWDKYSYTYFDVSLQNVDDVMIGKTTSFFQNAKKNEIEYPGLFLAYLKNRVGKLSRLTILPGDGLRDVIQNKGITRASFDTLILTYQSTADSKKHDLFEYFGEHNQDLGPALIGQIKSRMIKAKEEINKSGFYYRQFRKIITKMKTPEMFTTPASELIKNAPALFSDVKGPGLDDFDLIALTVIACKTLSEGDEQ